MKFPVRMFLAFLGVHALTALVFTLLSSVTHPLYTMVGSWPLFLQVVAASLFSFLVYLIPGYLFVISLDVKDELIKHADTIVVGFALVLLLVFMISFGYTMVLHTKQGWLIYSTINPVGGLLIYNLFNKIASWWDLIWVLTAFAPALGMLMGMYLRLKRENLVR